MFNTIKTIRRYKFRFPDGGVFCVDAVSIAEAEAMLIAGARLVSISPMVDKLILR